MPVRCIMQWEDNGHQYSAEGRLECSRGSQGQQTGYCIDIGVEEEILETVDPTWWTTRWLQLAVQGISDDEVPWYEFVAPLMMGAEGAVLSLAKHLLTIWQGSIRVQGWDTCPPTPTVLIIRQFMMRDEVQGDIDNSLWFEAYSHTLQSQRSCAWLALAVAEGEGTGGRSFPTGQGVLGGSRCQTRHLLYQTLLRAPTEGCVQEGEGHYLTCNHLPG